MTEQLPLSLKLNSWLQATGIVGFGTNSNWRGSFNSQILREFELTYSPYRFNDPRHASVNIVTRYFTELYKETSVEMFPLDLDDPTHLDMRSFPFAAPSVF